MERETHYGSVHDAFEKGDPGMAFVFGGLISVSLEGVGVLLLETGVGPVGDGARGENAGGGVWENENWETGVECALGGYVPAECDVVDAAEGEIGLPLERLDVGAEEGVAGGCDAEGGEEDGRAWQDWDGRVCVEREAVDQLDHHVQVQGAVGHSEHLRDNHGRSRTRPVYRTPSSVHRPRVVEHHPRLQRYLLLLLLLLLIAHPSSAISNVLNNPHKRHAPPKAHSHLPPVQPADLPRVRRKDFDSYLRAIAPEWDRFLQATSPAHSTPSPRLATPLDTIPSVFFHPDFDLADPRTFDAVTERVHADQDTSDPSSLSHSLPLLEKLSHHADTVEQHLVREISLRSTSFFAALTNLQDLQTESEHCLDRITKLRTLLNDLDNKTAIRGLHIIRMESRRSNIALVSNAVRELAVVVEMSSVAKTLATAGQWAEALAIIATIESLFDTSPPLPSAPFLDPRSRPPDNAPSPLPPTPESPLQTLSTARSIPLSSLSLSSLTAFLSLPSHLQALNTEITSSLTTDLVTVLKLDLLARINTDSDASHPVANSNLSLKDRLRPSLQGLLRTNGIRDAILSWRQVVMSEIRGIMKCVGATSSADHPRN